MTQMGISPSIQLRPSGLGKRCRSGGLLRNRLAFQASSETFSVTLTTPRFPVSMRCLPPRITFDRYAPNYHRHPLQHAPGPHSQYNNRLWDHMGPTAMKFARGPNIEVISTVAPVLALRQDTQPVQLPSSLSPNQTSLLCFRTLLGRCSPLFSRSISLVFAKYGRSPRWYLCPHWLPLAISATFFWLLQQILRISCTLFLTVNIEYLMRRVGMENTLNHGICMINLCGKFRFSWMSHEAVTYACSTVAGFESLHADTLNFKNLNGLFFRRYKRHPVID